MFGVTSTPVRPSPLVAALAWRLVPVDPGLVGGTLSRLSSCSRCPTGVEDRDYLLSLVIEALYRGEPYRNWLLIFDNARGQVGSSRRIDPEDTGLCHLHPAARPRATGRA